MKQLYGVFPVFFLVVIIMVVSSFLMGDGAFLVGDNSFLDPGPPPLAMLAMAAVRAMMAVAAKTGIMIQRGVVKGIVR
jgi:hypothetical protein